jgi:RNA polymerase sigma-70 factor (ECF subfamily)
VTAPDKVSTGRDAQAASGGKVRRVESDEALAAAAQRGNRHCFGVLVDRYAERVFRFVMARVRDRHDAEEITQEAFLRAWGALDRYDDRRRFSTWLYTIAHREAISTLRRDVARAAAREGGEERGEESTDPASDRTIWALAARTLGGAEYEALWLRYVEERTAQEIALILGRTSIGVRVMLSRARERLRAALSDSAKDRGGDQP